MPPQFQLPSLWKPDCEWNQFSFERTEKSAYISKPSWKKLGVHLLCRYCAYMCGSLKCGRDQSSKRKVQVMKINAISISVNTSTQRCHGQITERHSLTSDAIRRYAATGRNTDATKWKQERRLVKNQMGNIHVIKMSLFGQD